MYIDISRTSRLYQNMDFSRIFRVQPEFSTFSKEGQEYTPCTTHKTFGSKIYVALEVNSWYLSVQIKYTWRLVGMNAYMISCAPINLYLLIK